MKSCRDKEEVVERERRASRKDFMSRHHSEVATPKENKSGYNRYLRSRQVIEQHISLEVTTKNAGHD